MRNKNNQRRKRRLSRPLVAISIAVAVGAEVWRCRLELRSIEEELEELGKTEVRF